MGQKYVGDKKGQIVTKLVKKKYISNGYKTQKLILRQNSKIQIITEPNFLPNFKECFGKTTAEMDSGQRLQSCDICLVPYLIM